MQYVSQKNPMKPPHDRYHEKYMMFVCLIKKKNPTILEIGAHNGADSLRMLYYFEEGKIYSFEPDPRNITVHKKYVNNERCELYPIALSCENKEMPFFMPAPRNLKKVPYKHSWLSDDDYFLTENSASCSLKKSSRKDFENASEIIVKAEKLDTWISDKNIPSIDLIWMDVQGSEKDVLLGAINTLPRVSYIWTEYGEKEYEGWMGRDDTIELLKKLNFGIIEKGSSQGDSGDLLFYNKNIFAHL
jgi:2-O-methyltransferase